MVFSSCEISAQSCWLIVWDILSLLTVQDRCFLRMVFIGTHILQCSIFVNDVLGPGGSWNGCKRHFQDILPTHHFYIRQVCHLFLERQWHWFWYLEVLIRDWFQVKDLDTHLRVSSEVGTKQWHFLWHVGLVTVLEVYLV